MPSNDSRVSQIGEAVRWAIESDSALIAFYAESQHEGGGTRLYFTDENVVMPQDEVPPMEDTPFLALYPPNGGAFTLFPFGSQNWDYEILLTVEGGVYESSSNRKLLLRYLELVGDALINAGHMNFAFPGDPSHGVDFIDEWEPSPVVLVPGPGGETRGRLYQAFFFDLAIRYRRVHRS